MKEEGLVIKNTGNLYMIERFSDSEIFSCRIKGRFRMKDIRTTNPIAVGDRVLFEVDPKEATEGVITDILERKNYIIRKSTNLSKEAHIIATNIDQVFLVVTLDFPVTSYEFIDRFLVTCELYKIPVTLLLNKIDLFEPEMLEEFIANYTLAGYPIICCSAITGEGIPEIKAKMKDHISLFSGNSGVGKSTLIQAIAPQLELKIGEISALHQKGKHTTTFSEMYKLADKTYLIDTPGVKGFGLIDIKNDDLARYFPDLFHYAPECQFYNCTHTHEPRCAVKEMVEEGKIAWRRYESYLKILEDEKDKYRKQ